MLVQMWGRFSWEDTHSWTSLLDFADYEHRAYYGVESLAVDPQEPNRVYMSVGLYNWDHSMILRSDDYGKTFSVTKSPLLLMVMAWEGRQVNVWLLIQIK